MRSQHLRHALVYITNPEKTQHHALVGSVNCLPDAVSAYEQMVDTKKYFGKELGRQGYHIIISFEKGEASPETAFAIGEKFVQEFLQENYEAVYAVHDDKEHCHVHIVYNNVNMETGYKFQYKKGDWKNIMQPITNRLCEEHGLAVMPAEYAKEPANLERKDWEKQKGFDSLIMSDASLCMYAAEDLEHFLWLLRQLGYEVKNGVHIAVRAAGMKRYRRLDSLADYFSKEYLEKYVGAMQGESFVSVVKSSNPAWMRGKAKTPLQQKFYHRLFSLRMTEKERFTRHSAKFYKEIQEMHRIHEQYLYLCRKDIGSMEDLQRKDEELQEKIEGISKRQREIYRFIAKEKYHCKTPEDFRAFQINRLEYQKELDVLKQQKKKWNEERKVIKGIRAEAAKKVLYELERYQTDKDDLEIDRKKIDFPFYPFSKEEKKRQDEMKTQEEQQKLPDKGTGVDKKQLGREQLVKVQTEWKEYKEELRAEGSRQGDNNLQLQENAEISYAAGISEKNIQSLPLYPELPPSFAQYERLSYREKAERFNLFTKDYDEARKVFDVYLDRIGYHYEYFGSYMDEIKSLHKAAEDLFFERAVGEIAGQMKEQGLDGRSFTTTDISRLATIIKDYAENIEEITALVSRVFEELGVKVDFEKQYQIINEIYNVTCEENKRIRSFTL
ncbi:MAG: relaxase/mobilization nuclease domain-containing protein [Muribaculaceae bacterium]|nr:relaxase/mobilization nuclease domain-containing protein [Muribaculaceae bacterium]